MSLRVLTRPPPGRARRREGAGALRGGEKKELHLGSAATSPATLLPAIVAFGHPERCCLAAGRIYHAPPAAGMTRGERGGGVQGKRCESIRCSRRWQ